MPAFHYEAVDPDGKVRRGSLEAETARAARDHLRAEGLVPTVIDASDRDSAPSTVEHLRLSPVLVSLATRQLATLVRSGMPLDQALGAVAEQADDARVGRVMNSLRAQVAAGESLASALSRWPRSFGGLY